MKYNVWVTIAKDLQVMHLGPFGLLRTIARGAVSMIQIDAQSAKLFIENHIREERSRISKYGKHPGTR
jgi:hypothetical protein